MARPPDFKKPLLVTIAKGFLLIIEKVIEVLSSLKLG
jgi:hypothetical protein